MALDHSRAARDMLALEDIYRETGKLSVEESTRWEACARELFHEEAAQHSHRRSSRIPVAAHCQLKVGQGVFTARMSDISRIGFGVSSLVFRYITPETVEILSIELGDHSQELGLKCKVDRVEYATDPPIAGLTIQAHPGDDTWERFYDRIYYPAYIGFIEAEAKIDKKDAPAAVAKAV